MGYPSRRLSHRICQTSPPNGSVLALSTLINGEHRKLTDSALAGGQAMFEEARFTIRQTRGAERKPLAAIEFEDLLEGPVRSAQPAIAFGPFRLLPTQQLLLRAGRRVHLGSRAFEILVALVDRPGVVVSKAELIARVWPNTVVEESNLKVQVAGLRQALSDGREAIGI
jgi:DNA-binding response OmpR family regulator